MKGKLTIDYLQEQIELFRQRLDEIKKNNAAGEFTWYGYDILSNLYHINGLLTGKNREIFASVVGKHVADIGAADGDLSFFLESMGIKTDIIEYGPTNWNGLQGAYRLKKLLNSNIEIYDINLDSQFRLPFERYELVFFLGILYHLKNPFYILEALSKATRYLILSTRIANFSRKNGINYTNEPMAYLLAPDELNGDSSNYWIFSEAGLRRLVQRTGWKIRDFTKCGTQEIATPQDLDLDQRAFVFLESQHFS